MKNLIILLLSLAGPIQAATIKDSVEIYDQLGDYNKELRYLLISLDKSTSDTNTIHLNNSIGYVYMTLGNYSKSLEYFNKSLILSNSAKAVYKENTLVALGELTGYQKQFTKSRNYFTQALHIADSLKDEEGVAVLYTNLAMTDDQEKHFDNALKNLTESLKIFRKLNMPAQISGTLYIIAAVYEDQGNITVSLQYEIQAYEVANQGNYKNETKKALKSLSELYAKSKNFEQAYTFHLKYVNLKDSLFNEEKNKQVVEMQTKYETEKKEQQLKLQRADLTKKNIYAVVLLFAIVVALIIILLVYFNLRKIAASKKTIQIYSTIIEHKNKEMTDSIEYAKNIQATILPKIEETNVFVLFQPKDIVSGDFYWSNGPGMYAAADCTGHGVPGALMSMINSELLTKAASGSVNPALILTRANKYLNDKMKAFNRQDGMDICLVRVVGKTLYYAGANRPVFIVRAGELITLTPDKKSIGGNTEYGYEFTPKEFDLCEGDVIYLTTDGYGDQFGGKNDKKMGTKSFKEELMIIAPLTPEEQCSELRATHNDWKSDKEQTDDVLVIGIQI